MAHRFSVCTVREWYHSLELGSFEEDEFGVSGFRHVKFELSMQYLRRYDQFLVRTMCLELRNEVLEWKYRFESHLHLGKLWELMTWPRKRIENNKRRRLKNELQRIFTGIYLFAFNILLA
jgi:hypothetical protein